MGRSEEALREAIRDAAAQVREATGSSAWTVFEELDPVEMVGATTARYAVGLIEGAALALGLTPIELLDECGVSDAR